MTKFVTCENWFIKHMLHEICQNLYVKQDHDLGIHIPSHPRRLQSHMDDSDNFKSLPSDECSRFCSTTKSFQKFLYDFIHFPCVLITSHPLKSFRIMENNNQLLSAVKS